MNWDLELLEILAERQGRAEEVSVSKGHTLPKKNRWGPMQQWSPDPRGPVETQMKCTKCCEWVVVRAWIGPEANHPQFIGGMMFSPCWHNMDPWGLEAERKARERELKKHGHAWEDTESGT